MKRRFHALIFACVMASPLVHAGIPVLVDADPLREAEWLKEAQRWMKTAQHYQSQIQAYKDQLATATGVRDIADFVDQAKSLKSELEQLRRPGQTLNDLLLSGTTSRQFDTLYAKYRVFDTCNAEQSGSYADTCKQLVINKAIQFEQTDEIQDQVSQTLGEINILSNRIALSRDSKESQDLANSIQLKSVMLNTLTDQWEMSVKAAEKREKVLEDERIKQWDQQQLNAPETNFN
ncbi:type IV secretion system protein [Klebsiella pneumoniae]|uniref:type IV secretion system protein n=1 Tax=Klebsiella pneumoniae TaxID=573 RepID=UPI002DB925E7|nr:type IV secretion system protein [Klebsiella pneumoniae]MEB6348621.1 type IV secretion system protein [Klebsiella pneumoniae]